MGPPLLVVIDTNHDGVISAEEIHNAGAVLESLDKNRDGKITEEELRPPAPPEGQPQGQPNGEPPPGSREGMFPNPPPPVIEALDVDHDGTISAEELKKAPESLKHLDMDGDGALSPEELRPQGPPPGSFDEGAGDKQPPDQRLPGRRP
jgi:hypothetical protein